jgi:hypothetical protein
MKVELENIRLGGASLSDKVYVGVLTKDGKMWLRKQDVTNDFISAVIAKWNGFREVLQDESGKQYEIIVKEITPEKEYGRRDYRNKKLNK